MSNSSEELPVVSTHWFFGAAKEMASNPLDFVEREFANHGEFYIARFIFKNAYMISSPEAIRYITQTNQRNYVKDPAYRQLGLALGNGLLTNEGESWKKQRRLAQPAFYKKRLQGLFVEMTKIIDEYCDGFERHKGSDQTVNMLSEMMKVTSKVVMGTLLGSSLGSSLEEIEEAITTAQKYLVNRIRKPYTIPITYINGSHARFKSDIKKFDGRIYEVFEERRNQSTEGNSDLLSMLMEARDEEGQPMSDQQLRDEVITIFTAGHETSANALSWTFYLLCQHPEIYEKVKDEILGHKIPKRSFIFCSIWMLHHRADLWENPYKFDPERFSAKKVKERPKSHYIPFGAGPRMCIGNNFALMEIQLLLAMILQRFDFELDKDHPVELEPLVTLRPKYGIKMWVK